MPPGESITHEDPFLIVLGDGIEDGNNLEILVDLLDGEGNDFKGILNIFVSGNKINASNVDIVGSASDVMNPGETSQVKIGLKNEGTTNSENITGTITSSSPYIEILDNTGTWSSISSGVLNIMRKINLK